MSQNLKYATLTNISVFCAEEMKIRMEKILVVEDDGDINNLLAKIMKQQGYEVVQAFSGTEALLRLFQEEAAAGKRESENKINEYALILLDLMLPGMMGEQVLARIREISDIPVIVLSAKSALEDRVSLLNQGADDYLVKPFEKDEVVARVNGAIRRYRNYHRANGMAGEVVQDERAKQQVLRYKELALYQDRREAVLKGEVLNLTAHEYDILYLLVSNPNKVFSRENLYEEIWQGGYYGEDNTVNMHISNLRKKIAALVEEEYIKTVWGIGYKLV